MEKFGVWLYACTDERKLLDTVKWILPNTARVSLQDKNVIEVPVRAIVQYLCERGDTLSDATWTAIEKALVPVLLACNFSNELAEYFSTVCITKPKSRLLGLIFETVFERVLKYTTDFLRKISVRTFCTDYIEALSFHHDDRVEAVRRQIRHLHGDRWDCPHLRILPTMASVCFSGITNYFHDRRIRFYQRKLPTPIPGLTIKNIPKSFIPGKQEYLWKRSPQYVETERIPEEEDEEVMEIERQAEAFLDIYLSLLTQLVEQYDWRPNIAALLQPIPFPEDAYYHVKFHWGMLYMVNLIAKDERCDVHRYLLPIRPEAKGWFHVFCPGGEFACDNGELFTAMLNRLIYCCCRRKRFLLQVKPLLDPCKIMATRSHDSAIEVLIAILEFNIFLGGTLEEARNAEEGIVLSLLSTEPGAKKYSKLLDKQELITRMQAPGGPVTVCMPPKTSNDDLYRVLSSGSFGNLKYLNVAFTHVTNDCAKLLCWLPNLRQINFWGTQFGDDGLAVLSDFLRNLEVLNLCETPVTDRGLNYMTGMTSLRHLNLNSTVLSPLPFLDLKSFLPDLQEFDVRYTDAWYTYEYELLVLQNRATP